MGKARTCHPLLPPGIQAAQQCFFRLLPEMGTPACTSPSSGKASPPPSGRHQLHRGQQSGEEREGGQRQGPVEMRGWGLRADGAAQTTRVGSQEGSTKVLIYAKQMHQVMGNCSLLSEPWPGQSTGVTPVARGSQKGFPREYLAHQVKEAGTNTDTLNIKHHTNHGEVLQRLLLPRRPEAPSQTSSTCLLLHLECFLPCHEHAH